MNESDGTRGMSMRPRRAVIASGIDDQSRRSRSPSVRARIGFLLGATFLICATWLHVRGTFEPSGAFIVEMRSSRAGSAQLFYETSKGHGEAASPSVAVKKA